MFLCNNSQCNSRIVKQNKLSVFITEKQIRFLYPYRVVQRVQISTEIDIQAINLDIDFWIFKSLFYESK